MEYSECEELLATPQLHPTNLCSDHKRMGIGACNGDSGGPLVIENNGESRQVIGIVSWGYIPCGSGEGKPSVYTRVSAYIDWIKQIQSSYYALFKN